jgi:hypothetical protein
MTTAFEHIVTTTKPAKVELFREGLVGARLATYPDGLQAVMKPCDERSLKAGKKHQKQIPIRRLPFNEVAFYRLAKLLNLKDVVPETVLGSYGDQHASFQQYVLSKKLYDVEPALTKLDSEQQWVSAFTGLVERHKLEADMAKVSLLDFLACNRDRHGGNYGVRLQLESMKPGWKLVAWDNGVTFGQAFERYHCVGHKYLFRDAFPVEPLWGRLETLTRGGLQEALGDLLDAQQIDNVWLRAQFALEFPYRLPWRVLSKGAQHAADFPSWREYFTPMCTSTSNRLYILQ